MHRVRIALFSGPIHHLTLHCGHFFSALNQLGSFRKPVSFNILRPGEETRRDAEEHLNHNPDEVPLLSQQGRAAGAGGGGWGIDLGGRRRIFMRSIIKCALSILKKKKEKKKAT